MRSRPACEPSSRGPGTVGPPLHSRALRRAAVAAVIGSLLVAAPAAAHGEEFDVVVEAVVRAPAEQGAISYGIALTFTDGDPVSDATVAVTATGPDNTSIVVDADETVTGIYIADLSLPAPGPWRIEVAVEHELTDGAVAFDEVIGPDPPLQPVVRVDTAHPERQGTLAGDTSAIFGEQTDERPLVSTGPPVRIEALVREAVAPLTIAYGLAVDADPSTVTITAASADGETVSVALTELAPGVFSGTVDYPAAALWTVEAALDDGAGGRYEFTENLPWPHYSIEAGFPKIKVDIADPSLEGTLIDLADSAIFGVTAETTTTVATEPTTAPPIVDTPAAGGVTVDLPDNASELRRQVALRWIHTAAIGVWVVGIVLLAMDRRGTTERLIALIGIAAVVGTGIVLTLYGAPTTYPGLFRWSDLASRLYGPSYQWAFIVKMGFVAVAVVGTATLVARRWGVVLASIGIIGALAAVVAMLQFHLFAHL